MAQDRLAGTMIAAIFESLGYHFQGHILDVLKDPLSNQVGGLIYLVAIVMVLSAAVSQGGNKSVTWLLLGPPLFFATLFTRTQIPNAKWQFGDGQRNNAKVEKGVSDSGNTGEANVSLVFAKYVRMISETTKEMVRVISTGREKGDLDFILKADLFARLHAGREFDPGLRQLIHYALLGECGGIISAAEDLNNPLFQDPSTPGGVNQVDAAAANLVRQEAASRKAAAAEAFKNYRIGRIKISSDPMAFRYVVALEAKRVAGAGGTSTFAETEKAVRDKAFSCRQIWGYVLEGLLEKADGLRKNAELTAEEHGYEVDKFRNLILKSHGVNTGTPLSFDRSIKDANGNPVKEQFEKLGADDIALINRIIAQYSLRNEVSRGSISGWMSRFTQNHNFRAIETRFGGPEAFSEKSRLGATEWSERERLMSAAASMPYYQGLALYVLGTVFPFFALLLLIPGKHEGFLLWFILWMWAKSWDVGFAIIMLLDDLLFAMLSIGKQGSKIFEIGGPAGDVGVAMANLRAMDPTFQLSVHHSIIATSLLSIPTVMGLLIMGSLKAGTGIVARGAQAYSGHFALGEVNRAQQASIYNLRQQSLAHRKEAATSAADDMMNGRTGANASGAAKAGASGSAGSGASSLNRGSAAIGTAGGANAAALTERAQSGGVGLNRPLFNSESLRGNFDNSLNTAREGGFLGGLTKGGYSSKSGFVNSGAGLFFGSEAKINKAVSAFDREYAGGVLDIVAARLPWVSMKDEYSKSTDALIKFYGGIPLPDSNFTDEPSQADYNMMLFAFKKNVERKSIAIENATGVVENSAGLMSLGLTHGFGSDIFKSQAASVFRQTKMGLKAGGVGAGIAAGRRNSPEGKASPDQYWLEGIEDHEIEDLAEVTGELLQQADRSELNPVMRTPKSLLAPAIPTPGSDPDAFDDRQSVEQDPNRGYIKTEERTGYYSWGGAEDVPGYNKALRVNNYKKKEKKEGTK
jgi:hypothetical protein